jgi:hypothetical protein
MRRIALPLVFLFLGLFLLFAYYRMRANHEELLATRAELAQAASRFDFKMAGDEVTLNGAKVVVSYSNSDTANVDVKRENSFKIENEHVYAKYAVTIKNETPVLLSKESIDKIKPGMSYAEVGTALGGSMEKGALSDGFYGSLEVTQGKKQITLVFENGKLVKQVARERD